jgi:RNA polymerase sigma-70 factor (ECF subfamily)
MEWTGLGCLMTVSEDFTSLADQYRGELLAHCYRMLGSAEDAEDLVQETYLRAWRAYDSFEGRSSMRTWLYKIATNACLTAIERRGRRPLPSGLGGPADDMTAPLEEPREVPWLQPIPDALLAGQQDDPAAVTASRAGVRLAFVAALQYLSARQRAVLILRDVLEWPASEVAGVLGTTTTAVNSSLRRARAQLSRELPAEEELAEPAEPELRALLERFAVAFEGADVAALTELLRQDVALEMPPIPTWFAGREAVVAFFASYLLDVPGRFRLVPVMANGQSAFAAYQRESGPSYHAHAVVMPTAAATGIGRIVIFLDPRRHCLNEPVHAMDPGGRSLFPAFGLPQRFDAAAIAPAQSQYSAVPRWHS